MTRKFWILILGLAVGTLSCQPKSPVPLNQDDYFEGVAYDEDNPGATLTGGKEDNLSHVYDVPTNLPDLVAPEIIVSIKQLTLHIFDRQTGFSRVFPVGLGVINQDGVSVSPTGHFATGPDVSDRWWYIPRRTVPSHFGGWPFLRLTTENSLGQNTYGIHGPITQHLTRGYVSHGCVRMEGSDLIQVYYLVADHASTPVTIQREPELDAASHVVDLGSDVTLWGVDDEIQYGDSVGDAPPRDDTGTDNNGCADDRLESSDPVPLEPELYRGLVVCPSDRDVYRIHVSQGSTLAVTITFANASADLDMLLTDDQGVVVDRSDSTSDREMVQVQADQDRFYDVTIYAYEAGATTSYDLTIEVQ